MPYSGSPQSIARDAVRLLVGDVSTSNEFLTDGDYDYFVSATPNTYLAAQLAANSLAALFAGAAASASGTGYVEKSVGDLKIKKADAIQAVSGYKSLAALFGRQAAANITPFSGGMSASDKSANTADTDNIAPPFVSKLFDNSGAIDFTPRSTRSNVI